MTSPVTPTTVLMETFSGADVGGALSGASTAIIGLCCWLAFLGAVWLFTHGWRAR